MGNKIYVGNLSFQATEEGVSGLFAKFGNVQSVRIVTDRDTGRSRGFAFVEMSTSEEAEQAINALNGQEHDGRALTVNEARPMPPRGGGGGGDRPGRGGGGGGGGGFNDRGDRGRSMGRGRR